MTMLEATADANNRNAYDLALAKYRTAMDRVAGPEAPFLKESELTVSEIPSLISLYLLTPCLADHP
jgi:hypothetical protein